MADRVVVKLVEVLEEAQLPGGAVAQGVGVLAWDRQQVVAAGVDAHAVAALLGEPGLGLPVAQHLQNLQADHHAVAVAVAVAGGEVAHDAAPDVLALGAHADVLGDVQAAVGIDDQFAVIGSDALLRGQ